MIKPLFDYKEYERKTQVISINKNSKEINNMRKRIFSNLKRKGGSYIKTTGEGSIIVCKNKSWFMEDNADYIKFKEAFNNIKGLKIVDEKIIINLKDIEKSLNKLEHTIDSSKFRPVLNICIMVHDCIYKTSVQNLTVEKIEAIIQCLEFIIDKNCSRDEQKKANRILKNVNLNWITGDGGFQL